MAQQFQKIALTVDAMDYFVLVELEGHDNAGKPSAFNTVLFNDS